MKRIFRQACKISLACACLALSTAPAPAQTGAIAIQADQAGASISSNLFGIFFEEINSAGDGGIYAELVRNRSFEDSTNSIPYWTLVTNGSAAGQMSLDTSLPLSATNLHALKLTKSSGTGSLGAANGGYWGIPLTSGATYNLGFYARGAGGFSGSITVLLESGGGTIYAQTAVSGLTTSWQHFTLSLVPNQTDPAAQLVLEIARTGTVYLDFVSLFPQQTFNSRANGLRPDLAAMLVNLKPSFVRFPGGSWVDGISIADAYHWEPTVGDPANRVPRANLWGYMVDNGLGYHEYLQMCEDIGALPLFAVNCGMDVNQNAVPTSQLGPWVQEAVDAIQYATGPTNTPWGAQRAANGHPAPFNLQFMEIGNENNGSAYNANYSMFYTAIKSNYPFMHLIANSQGTIPTSSPVEIVDEHYYTDQGTFISYATKYDSYSRAGPKVFVGEYAVTSGSGNGNLAGALGEAAFMTGMERNSDLVELASYAPLFANLNNKDWNPDMIYFTGTQVYGTPSYYVQQMFSRNRGDYVLPATVAATNNSTNGGMRGAIGLGSWNTSVQYTNIVVTSNGVTLYQSDFVDNGTSGWRVFNGTWSAANGVYQQTAITTDCYSTSGNTNWANYTLTLQALKVSGDEGFLILFNFLDDNNWTWWNIAGWGNTLDGIEQMSGGGKSLISSQISESVNANQWYTIRVVLSGPRVQCYLNGVLIHDITYPSGLIASTSYSKAAGQIIVKAVNPYSTSLPTTFNVNGLDSVSPTATLIQLTSGNPADENSLSSPTYVFPVTNSITNAGTNFTLTLPAYSLSILRLNAGGIHTFTNLQLQVSSPINARQTVAAVLWGWESGQANPVNLTANTNHAITYSSADANVAVVDAYGNVTGVGPGTTSITANYGSLGLSASQSVRVVGLPNTLVHRYSFSDFPGSNTVADSVGGSAWNGTLPNGGTFGSGQLTLASASQQYVQLPAGILSNYTAVTIEAWVTFPDQLPVNCFFYGFGNTDGSGNGENYIFCAPQGGRIAVTAADPGYTGEQNATGAGDLSYNTNLHFVAVYDPPAGFLALYTNGALAAINTAVSVPLSAVSPLLNYIGRSLYNVDPYPDISLDEFRIYSGALDSAEIAATQALGPNQLLSAASPVISGWTAGGNLTLTWPLAAAGFALQSATNLAANGWTAVPVTPQIVAGQWQASAPQSGNAQFFRLTK
ncbi:MAG: alpha-L-arabinofuranosidase C-terminal domain-containing protein [Verrucomicrobiota bacterium]